MRQFTDYDRFIDFSTPRIGLFGSVGDAGETAFFEIPICPSFANRDFPISLLYPRQAPSFLIATAPAGPRTYAIVADAFGLIYMLIDLSDGAMAVYSYDLWGVPTLSYDGTSEGIGSLNRLLSKGYLYDDDLRMYCLGRRHYDPMVARFLEPDDFRYLDHRTMGGLNPFVYCNNNPIEKVDYTGHLAVWAIGLIAGAIIGALVGGTYGGLSAAARGANGWQILGAIGIGAFVGLIMGAGAGFGSAILTSGIAGVTAWSGAAWGIGLGVSAASGALGGFTMDTLSQIMYSGNVEDWESVGWSSLQGAFINVISMLSTSIGGGAGSSWVANFGMNFVMGFPVSSISFTIDILRYFVWVSEEEKEQRRRRGSVLALL